MKLSAKFKKILWSGFRATLNLQLVKVALNYEESAEQAKFWTGRLIRFLL